MRTSANTAAVSSLPLPRSSSVMSLRPSLQALAMGVNGRFWERQSLGSLPPYLPSPTSLMDASQAAMPPVPLPTAWK